MVVAEIGTVSEATARYEEAKLSVRRQVEPHETPLPEMMKHVVGSSRWRGPYTSRKSSSNPLSLGISPCRQPDQGCRPGGNQGSKAERRNRWRAILSTTGTTSDCSESQRGQILNTLRRPREILPPEEIKVAIAQVVEENFGAERDQLAQAVARLFGFASTSSQFREAVEGTLADLLEWASCA